MAREKTAHVSPSATPRARRATRRTRAERPATATTVGRRAISRGPAARRGPTGRGLGRLPR
eukprot:6782056-Pyramimonas_sp.AAC.1